MNKALFVYVWIGACVSAGALSAASNSTGMVLALIVMGAYWIGVPWVLGTKYEKEEAERKAEKEREDEWRSAELKREIERIEKLPCPGCGSMNTTCFKSKNSNYDSLRQRWIGSYTFHHSCQDCGRRWLTFFSNKEILDRPMPWIAPASPQCSNCLSDDTELEKTVEDKDSNTVIYYYHCKGCGRRWTKIQTKNE